MKRISLICIICLLIVPLVALADPKPLPETYTSDDGRLTLRYPTGWAIQSEANGLVIVATSEMFLQREDIVTLSSGEAGVLVLFLNVTAVGEEAFTIDPLASNDPLVILDAISEALPLGGDAETILDPVESTTYSDHPAAHTDGIVAGNPIFLILVKNGDKDYTLIMGVAAPGELPKYEPKLLAIAESVRYQPPDEPTP
jgi:hypothetical protein